MLFSCNVSLFILILSCFLFSKELQSESWSSQTLEQMSLDEKIGQLFMVGVPADMSQQDVDYVDNLIKEQHIGGILFIKRVESPLQQLNLTNYFQEKSKIPLFIAHDSESGLSFRFKNVISFPNNMTLGAIEDESLIYAFGNEVARQCKLIGINVNFAPVVDINTNPENTVINNRSFGENKEKVALYGIQFMKGLQDGGVVSCAKHFPGHGDTLVDSHVDLPVVKHSVDRLNDIELYPFRKMIDEGVKSVMIGHLNIENIDPGKPASLSKKINIILKKKTWLSGYYFYRRFKYASY